MVSARTSRNLLLLGLALAGGGCSYDWNTQPAKPETTSPVDTPTPTPKAPTPPSSDQPAPAPSAGAYCSSTTMSFCDDFDGQQPSVMWDGVVQRSPATVATISAASAPSGSKVLEIKTSRLNNPGEAYVEKRLAGTPTSLNLIFWVRRPAGTVDRTVDVLRLWSNQRDGSIATIVWSFASTGESTLRHTAGGAEVDSVSTGTILTDEWLRAELQVDGAGTTFTVGTTVVNRTPSKAWDPAADGTRVALGLLNLVNQGGGWQLQFDNVSIR